MIWQKCFSSNTLYLLSEPGMSNFDLFNSQWECHIGICEMIWPCDLTGSIIFCQTQRQRITKVFEAHNEKRLKNVQLFQSETGGKNPLASSHQKERKKLKISLIQTQLHRFRKVVESFMIPRSSFTLCSETTRIIKKVMWSRNENFLCTLCQYASGMGWGKKRSLSWINNYEIPKTERLQTIFFIWCKAFWADKIQI